MPTLNRPTLRLLQRSLFRAGRFAKKALHPGVSAFFVSVAVAAPAPVPLEDGCFIEGRAETVTWDYIVDGDTLWLKDGRKVRFAAINTPETEHDGLASEPFGDAATAKLRSMLEASSKLMLQKAGRGEDHHGRVLGNIFLPDGKSLEAILLRQGLGFQIFSEGNSPYTSCFSQQEQVARTAGSGVWSGKPVLDINQDKLSQGFHLIQGRVAEVRTPRNSDYFWVELKGPLVLRVLKAGADERQLRNLTGRKVEVRGWVIPDKNNKQRSPKNKSWIMGVYNSLSISPM